MKVLFINKGHSKHQITIGLYIGWNRIIKRLFKKLDYQVIQLDRVSFSGFSKKNIKRRNWCFLNKKQVENILVKK